MAHVTSPGKILEVDLTTGDTVTKPIPRETSKRFLGGLGLNAWLLYRHTGPDTDPLGPDNVVLVSPGLLTGTMAPTSPRVEVTTKSPLTDLIGTGNSGGYWGPRLKKAGLDSLIIRGASEKPVYLVIDEGDATLRGAGDIWGLDSYEATDELKRRHGDEFSVMAIGPAGENQVRFAAPVFDRQHMPGRCHAGAVLGSKKLKAVAVKGSQPVEVHDREAFSEVVARCEERIRSYPAWKARAKAGSMGTIGVTEEGVDYDEVVGPYLRRGDPGVYCPCMMEGLYGCSLLADVKEGPYAGVDVACAGLTLYSGAAAQYGIGLPAAFKVNELCQRYGMDMFGSFFYAYELYMRGIISEETIGFRLKLGDDEALMRLLGMIAYREGFGDVLAEGALRAAAAIGGDAHRYVPAVKGLEVMRLDPRAAWKGNVFTSMSILTNPRGGDDLKGTHGVSNYPGVSSWARKLGIDREEYGRWLMGWLDMPGGFKERVFGDPPDIGSPDELLMTLWYNHLTSAYNSLGLCMFSSSVADALGPSYQAALYSAAAGVETTAFDIMETGERIFNLMRMYIVREGVGRADDHWPDSFYEEPSTAGGEKGPPFDRATFEEHLTRYYRLRGWDERGIPKDDTLRRLGLDEIAGDPLSL